VLPIVLGIIYILLFLTYRSFLEAAHVLLAVPFALTGGVYLLYALDYNFSVSVWVGFIALFDIEAGYTEVLNQYYQAVIELERAVGSPVK
jgi:Cu(I)/Ag(I) efflux system membrane protein CusA/SilA